MAAVTVKEIVWLHKMHVLLTILCWNELEKSNQSLFYTIEYFLNRRSYNTHNAFGSWNALSPDGKQNSMLTFRFPQVVPSRGGVFLVLQ
jgi:hypothetical protein